MKIEYGHHGVFGGIKSLCNSLKFENASTVEKFQCYSFAKEKVEFNIYETVEVNLI